MTLRRHQLEYSGYIRFDIEGKWSVQEFTRLLENIRTLYVDVIALDHLSNNLQRQREYDSLESTFKFYRTLSTRLTSDIYIQSLHFMSPGWAEMIGSWNPLKIITDFITNWRRENTERDKNTNVAELEKLRIRSEFGRFYLDKIEMIRAAGTGEDVNYIMHSVLDQMEQAVADIAKNSRVKEIQLNEVPQPGLLGPSREFERTSVAAKKASKKGVKVSAKKMGHVKSK